jgi:hypothetical protein
VSSQVQGSEPTLYRTEFTRRYPEYQNWVLKHQRFITKNQIHLRLLLHKPGRHLKIDKDIAPLFEKFYKVYRDFIVEFPLNAESHLGMITDSNYRQEFKVKLITVLTEVVYSKSLGIEVELPFFNSETCDYFAQPFNAVWFSLHGMLLIDQYLTLINPNEWEVYKVENGISLDEERIDDDLGELTILSFLTLPQVLFLSGATLSHN